MICPNCQYDIQKENPKFCPGCGNKISSSPETEQQETQTIGIPMVAPAKEIKKPTVKIKLSKGLIASLIAVIVVVVGGIGLSYTLKPPTAQKVIGKFLDNLKKEKYEAAYKTFSDLSLVGKPLVDSEHFKKSFEEFKVTDYRFVVQPMAGPNTNNQQQNTKPVKEKVLFNVKLISNDKVMDTVVALEKDIYGDSKKAEWRISPIGFMDSIDIDVYAKDITITVNGKTLQPNIPGTNKISASVFKNFKGKLNVTGADIEPIEMDIRLGEEIILENFQLAKSVQEEVKSIVGKLPGALEEYFKSPSFKPFEEIFLKGSYAYRQWYREDYSGINTHYSKLAFKDLKFTEFRFKDKQLKQIRVQTEQTVTTWYYDDGRPNIKYYYILEKDTNGKWKITDFGQTY